MKTNMKPELIEITPELAAEWLKYNHDNRNLPVGNSKYYARLIESGEFFLTHQGLAFTGNRDNPGRLIDGQTRLTAIIATGTNITQWVFWNCSEHTFQAIDGGKQRSFIDHHGWDKQRIAFVNTVAARTAETDMFFLTDGHSAIRSVNCDPKVSHILSASVFVILRIAGEDSQ